MKILPPADADRSSVSVMGDPRTVFWRATANWHASCEGTGVRGRSPRHAMSRQRLDSLVSWRAARALAAAVHRATAGAPFHADTELRAGLRDAATAVMTAIAEGYEQRTCSQFECRLAAALSATARLESLICLAEDMDLLTHDASNRLRRRVAETADVVGALRQVVARYQRLHAMPAPSRVN